MGFGDGGVVGAGFDGVALEEDSLGGFVAAGEDDALGDGGGFADDLDGDFGGRVT